MTKLVRFDWAIKYLLRHKANFDILEGFLSELLATDIKIESVLESESNKETVDDKFNRVDLLVKAGHKERIIVEVQCYTQWDYLSHILYGISKVVGKHIKEGNSYREIGKVISISIVFFNLGEGRDYLYKGTTNFVGMNYHDRLKLSSNELKVYGQDKNPSHVFPEYYIIKVNQFNDRIQSKFDEWVYFLKNGQIKPTFSVQGIQSAAKKLDIPRLDENKRRAYEYYQEVLHYDASMALPYEIGKEESRKEGLLKGTQFKIAKSLKQAGIPIEEVLQHTGLKEEDIL